jgi:hypothetical protein
MAEHAEVFISGTTCDLGGYRREIKEALLTLKIFPIEESNFELTYGPLVTMLRGLIGRCDAVIHLAGFYYGMEPPQRPPGQRRRSYTQIEYDVARELKKPLYLFLATENYEPDKPCTAHLSHRRHNGLRVANREHNRLESITSLISGPHSLRITRPSGPHCVRTGPHYLRTARKHPLWTRLM